MTISTITPKSRYAGDGVTTSFPTGFKFLDNDHVKVILRAIDGSETLWTEGSEYSLNGAGAPGGGTVTVNASPTDHTPAVGETLVVKLAVPARQETSLPLGGAFPSTTVEGMADLAALRDQQIGEALSRAVKFKETTALADVEFPEPEAAKLVAWNSGGTGLENVAKPGDGVDGATIRFGAGAPAGGLGVVGDAYKDTATSDVYEKTGVSSWTLRGNDRGLQGIQGVPGADGLGVPTGGTTGQVLRKASNANHDTEWSNPAAAPVDSVFGRSGAVVAASGDYNAGQISETSGAKIMTSAERTKLAGIASGAEVNPAVPSQAQAENGTSTTEYSWTPQRVHQAAKDAVPWSLVVAIGDETTALSAGNAKVTFRLPHAVTLAAVRASLTTESSAGDPTFDINEGGVSLLSTKLSIDAGEKTSTTAATPAVISDASLADDAEITVDIDAAGTGAAGAKVTLIGIKTTT